MLKLINLIHIPREGIFKRDLSNPDYYFWNLRNLIKKWPLLVMASNPFPWCKNRFTLRFFGTSIGKHCLCDNCWISSELVSIGNNVIIGTGTVIISHTVESDMLILKRTRIENNVLIGAKCILMPGTLMKEGAKLSAHSFTLRDQVLEKDLIYHAHPARLKAN
ncbi:MAG: acyltransferase [Promethearchaeota archaeon]